MKPLLAAILLAAAAPAWCADVIRGQQLYRMHCASCHGASGAAVMPNAPSFSRGEATMRPDTQLLMAIRTGRGAMPGYFGVLSDRDTFDVIAYMRTLR